jgi:hypothetical protein
MCIIGRPKHRTNYISSISSNIYKYCRDQAWEELWLMMGGGLPSGAAGGIKTKLFGEPLTIIGSATALLFGGTLKRKFNLKKKLSAKQS